MLRRHPGALELAAWFDGESTESVGPHVACCGRCRRRVSELSRVRAWIRAQPFFAMGDEEPSSRGGSLPARWKVAAALAMVVMAFLLGGPDYGADTAAMKRAARDAAQREAASESRQAPAASGSATADSGPADDWAGKVGGAPPQGEAGADAGLRLGLVVPMSGPLAAEGAEVLKAVRGRVAVANASGGVGGLRVTLMVAAAENKKDVAALAGNVSAFVGGFGADPPRKGVWLFPADANVAGSNVVRAEASAHSAGLEVASSLPSLALLGPVGVVRGSGPEAAMEAGVAARARTTTVAAQPGTSCGPEVSALRQAGSVALVIAGPPELAARCLGVARAESWQPPLGVFVPPSAAYAGVGSLPDVWGARTVLALPWPTSSLAGAARFRVSTQSTSYRALVSFAAVELAIDVARQQGSVSMATVAAGRWRSDLVELAGTTAVTKLVMAGPESWLPVPGPRAPGPQGPSGPLALP